MIPAFSERAFDLVDDGTQMHHHLTVLGLDVASAFALQHSYELGVRPSVGLLPECRKLVRSHEPKCEVMDDALDAVRDGRR